MLVAPSEHCCLCSCQWFQHISWSTTSSSGTRCWTRFRTLDPKKTRQVLDVFWIGHQVNTLRRPLEVTPQDRALRVRARSQAREHLCLERSEDLCINLVQRFGLAFCVEVITVPTRLENQLAAVREARDGLQQGPLVPEVHVAHHVLKRPARLPHAVERLHHVPEPIVTQPEFLRMPHPNTLLKPSVEERH